MKESDSQNSSSTEQQHPANPDTGADNTSKPTSQEKFNETLVLPKFFSKSGDTAEAKQKEAKAPKKEKASKSEEISKGGVDALPDTPDWISADKRKQEQVETVSVSPKKPRKPKYKRIIALVILIIIVLAGLAYCFYPKGSNEHNNQTFTHTASSKAINILLLGVDKRHDDGGRSDTMMLFTVNPKDKSASLLSLPRDTRVPVKKDDFEKLNHAFAYGGSKLSRQMVEELLHVPVTYYVEIDIQSFEKFIDSIGGIDINVEKRMYYTDPYDDNGGLVIDLYPGEQHLNGKTAMEYVRYRDGEGDIGRIRRQQKFIRAILDKVISPAILPKVPEIIHELMSTIHTDMPISEMLSLATDLPSIQKQGLKTTMLPGKPAYVHDISYWIPNIIEDRELAAANMGIKFDAKNDKDTQDFINYYQKYLPSDIRIEDNEEITHQEETTKTETKSTSTKEDTTKKEKPIRRNSPEDITVYIINDSGINGAAAEIADTLKRKGFKISGVETGDTSSRANTIILANEADLDNFYGMPFKCTLIRSGSPGQAVIHVGGDYGQ